MRDKQGNREDMRRRGRKERQLLILQIVHGSSQLTSVASDYREVGQEDCNSLGFRVSTKKTDSRWYEEEIPNWQAIYNNRFTKES